MKSIAKAYGKILVFGAYSILEPGNIGLVVNINKGTKAAAEETKSGRIVLDLSNFEINVYGSMDNGKLTLSKDNETIKFIKNAVELSYEYLNLKSMRLKDIKLISVNDPELYVKKFKTGFGSSATATVSAVAALLALHEIDDRNAVFRISQYSHFKSQGFLGSGFDISAACFGSHFFLSRAINPDESYTSFIGSKDKTVRQNFEWPQILIPVIAFTGQSASTTDLVKKVMDYKKREPGKYKDFIAAYNDINISLKKVFDENKGDKIITFLEKSWQMRKLLGKLANADIEPERFTKLISEIKEKGALAAGLIGAGGGDSILVLCDNARSSQRVIEFLESKRLEVFDDVKFVNKGYEILG